MSFDSLLHKAGTPNGYNKLNSYYYGDINLNQLGVSLPPEVRALEMSVMWPKLAVDVLVESLVLEGFTVAGGDTPAAIRRIFQANNFDTLWPLAMTEALVQRRSYVVVGRDGSSTGAVITAHSPKGFAVARDHYGKITEAVRRYKAGDNTCAVHYTPGETTWYIHRNGQWRATDRQTTRIEKVPVVELVNRARLDDNGYSEIQSIAGLCDGATRSIINLQVAQEMLSMPMRYLFGDGADEEQLDQFGQAVSKLDIYWGHLITGPAGSSAGTLQGASLEPIISAFKLYAQQVSALTGIPPSMLGITSDANPTSAEAMQVAKDRLVTRAQQKQNMFGDSAEDIARLCLEIVGEPIEGLETLEARWRDPSVASPAARNAQVLQAHAQGIISSETARSFLGLTPEQMAKEAALDINARAALGA